MATGSPREKGRYQQLSPLPLWLYLIIRQDKTLHVLPWAPSKKTSTLLPLLYIANAPKATRVFTLVNTDHGGSSLVFICGHRLESKLSAALSEHPVRSLQTFSMSYRHNNCPHGSPPHSGCWWSHSFTFSQSLWPILGFPSHLSGMWPFP